MFWQGLVKAQSRLQRCGAELDKRIKTRQLAMRDSFRAASLPRHILAQMP